MQFALQNFQVLHSVLFPFLNRNVVIFIRRQVGAFFNKWTRDFADVQEPNGSYVASYRCFISRILLIFMQVMYPTPLLPSVEAVVLHGAAL